jgi:hypothetical protein
MERIPCSTSPDFGSGKGMAKGTDLGPGDPLRSRLPVALLTLDAIHRTDTANRRTDTRRSASRRSGG